MEKILSKFIFSKIITIAKKNVYLKKMECLAIIKIFIDGFFID